MEARAHLDERGQAPVDLDAAGGGGRDARQELEERALAGAVAADDAHHLAPGDLEAHVAQRPERARADAVDAQAVAPRGALLLPLANPVALGHARTAQVHTHAVLLR